MDIRQNILEDYSFVLSKTKKKFMKKPKYEEASDDLSYLAQTLKNQECPAYAGLMMKSKAKCEHELKNTRKEIEALIEAGHLFFEAELETATLGCVSTQTYLTSGIYCFNLAIKLQVELKDFYACLSLSRQVAKLLVKLSQRQDALKTLKYALTLVPETCVDLLDMRDDIIDIQIVGRDYHDALAQAAIIRKAAKKITTHHRKLFSKNELTYMLLVLVMRVEKVRYEQELEELISEYHPDDVITKSKLTMIDDHLFFWMQGLLMAYIVQDWDNIALLEADFNPILTPGQMQLFYIIHTKKRCID